MRLLFGTRWPWYAHAGAAGLLGPGACMGALPAGRRSPSTVVRLWSGYPRFGQALAGRHPFSVAFGNQGQRHMPKTKYIPLIPLP
ncbi:MAG TPA: hypothetical protein PKD90_10785 [Phnomibacter sp.]|nr:hypothetical protein [Phnomibacter sp.]